MTDGDDDMELISSEVTLLYNKLAILIFKMHPVHGALYYTIPIISFLAVIIDSYLKHRHCLSVLISVCVCVCVCVCVH